MTFHLQTLQCAECGSGVFQRSGLNQYTCQHCGAVALVEDDVSQRLDRVLDQVKDAAAQRLAAEQSARNRQVNRSTAIVMLVTVGLMVGITALNTVFSSKKTPRLPASPPTEIPLSSLKIDPPRQVLVGRGSSARPKLLVTVHNESGVPMDRPGVKVTFFDGDNKLDNRSETVPVGVLAPGEAAPILIDLPSDKAPTRQIVEPERVSALYRTATIPPSRFAKVRLIQQKDDLRFAGLLVNTLQDTTLTYCSTLVMLYDDSGSLIGFGQAYSSTEIKPGERTPLATTGIQRFDNKSAITAWDYRLDCQALDASGSRGKVATKDRVIRMRSAPEVMSSELRMSTEDLLADDSERFDLQQLELLPLVAGRNETQNPVYLTELVNHSKDQIAVAPGLVISRYDGSKLDGTSTVDGIAYLYPGERLPIQLSPHDADRITQTRVEWKPMRRAALPGTRVPLEVQVTGTQAKTSTVLVNFSREYRYKYVQVQGTVSNPGTSIVRKATVWVSLKDRDGKLSGYARADNLPAIAPGESVPFELKIKQYGRDFASVGTVYQTE